MDQPLLSIIVPSFNQASYIAETLSEPLRLRGRGVETIVIDGGSNDGTKEILERLDDQIAYWVSEKDEGQAHAINKGFSRATGKWIAFQNSDDFYLPGALEKVLHAIDTTPGAEVILGGIFFVDKEGKPFRRLLPKPLYVPALSQLNLIHNQALFIRSDLFSAVGGIREDARFCLDYEWFLRIWRKGPKVKYIYRCIAAQRFHDDTKTSNMQDVHDVEFDRYSKLHFSTAERMVGWATLPAYKAFRYLFGLVVRLRSEARP